MRFVGLLALPVLALLLLAAHLVHSGVMPLAALAALAFQHPVLRAYFGLPATPATGPSAR